jgi:hypothetical protein
VPVGGALEALEFYRSRLDAEGNVRPWDVDDLAEFAGHGDPFAGRVAPGDRPTLSFQLEVPEEPVVWIGAEPAEVYAWSMALEQSLRLWGLGPGDTLALFDYGSSPLVLLSSSAYLPYLGQGAAQRLGVTTVCCDGVANAADRMAETVEMLDPAAIVLRAELVVPLAGALRRRGVRLRCRWVALCCSEGAPRRVEAHACEQALQVPTRRVLRADAAFVLAPECPTCDRFHLDSDLYRLETVQGAVTVTTLFARRCPSHRYLLGAAGADSPGCPAAPDSWRVRWD